MGDDYQQRSFHPLITFFFFLNVIFAEEEKVKTKHGCTLLEYGVTYIGTRNITESGKTCQPWVEDSPHIVHEEIMPQMFPDGSKTAAKNYCRNPDIRSRDGVWCYTMDEAVEWEYCDVCAQNYEGYNGCTLINNGASYRGNIDRTQSFTKCDNWEKHPDSNFSFSDGSAKKARNYCRNPDPQTYEAPWCFIEIMEGSTWEYCDICRPFQGEVLAQQGGNSVANYKNPDMHFLACLHFCLIQGSCVGIVRRIDRNECSFFTRLDGQPNKDTALERHTIKRVCNLAAKGKSAHFVEVRGLSSVNGISFLKNSTVEQCDYGCIKRPDCSYYERIKDGECFYQRDVCCPWMRPNPFSEICQRHPIRCDPSKQPTTFLEELTKEKAPIQSVTEKDSAESNQSTTEEESADAIEESEAGGSSMFVIALAAAIIALGGGGFAYYKLVFLKKKGEGEDKGKDKANDKGKDTGKDNGKDKDTGKGEDKSKDKDKAKDKGKDKGKDKEKGKDKGKDKDTGKGTGKGKGEDKSKGKDKNKDKEKGKGKDKSKDKGKDKGKDQDKGKDKDKDKGRGTDKGKDKGKDKGRRSGSKIRARKIKSQETIDF